MERVPRPVLETLILPHAFDDVVGARSIALTCRMLARAMRNLAVWRPWLVRQQQLTRCEMSASTALANRPDAEWVELLARTLPDVSTLVQSFSCRVATGFPTVLPTHRLVLRSWSGGGFQTVGRRYVVRGLFKGNASVSPALVWDGKLCYKLEGQRRTLQNSNRAAMVAEGRLVQVPGSWSVECQLAQNGYNTVQGSIDGGATEELIRLPLGEEFPEHVVRVATGESLCCKSGRLCQLECPWECGCCASPTGARAASRDVAVTSPVAPSGHGTSTALIC